MSPCLRGDDRGADNMWKSPSRLTAGVEESGSRSLAEVIRRREGRFTHSFCPLPSLGWIFPKTRRRFSLIDDQILQGGPEDVDKHHTARHPPGLGGHEAG